MEGDVGAVELHEFSERVGSVVHELKAGREFGEPPGVGGGVGDIGESGYILRH